MTIPDPLFDDAPSKGVDPHGFQWAKATKYDKVRCVTCTQRVEGRRYRVRMNGLWHHAGCVDLYALGDRINTHQAAPRPRKPKPPKPFTRAWYRAVVKAQKAPNFRLELF